MRKIVKAMRKVIYLRGQSNFKRYINNLLEKVDFTPIVNIVPKEIKYITFVIPSNIQFFYFLLIRHLNLLLLILQH